MCELPLLLPSTPRLQAQSHASTILPNTLPQALGAVSSHCFRLSGSEVVAGSLCSHGVLQGHV